MRIPSPPPELPADRDPHERMLLSLAFAVRADALVTGDKDLLELISSVPDLPIMKLAEFRRRLEQTRSG